MHTTYVLVASLLAGLLLLAAARKLSHRPDVVASYARVGVPEARLNLLASLLVAGAAGLLAGIVIAPLGVAAAVSLVAYFLFAVVAHARHRDAANAMTPIVLLLLSSAALVLRVIARATG